MITNNTYPKVLEAIAHQIAKVRSELSKSIYAENTGGYRGEREYQISYMGILAEIVGMHIMEVNNIKYDSAPLMELPNDNNQLKYALAPDIVLDNGTRIDIKATKDINTLYINHRAHNNKNKRPDWYWFIQCDNGTATSIKVRAKDVDQWDVSQSTFTKVYSKQLSNNNNDTLWD